MSPLPPQDLPLLDLEALSTYSIAEREHLVSREQLAVPVEPEVSLGEFLDSLPHLLAVERLRALADALAAARAGGRRVLLGLGGHVVKAGLGPLVADMVARGLVTDLALNGSAAIHDYELALVGKTSEKVSATLADGRFGMIAETAAFFARAFARGAQGETGLGRAVAEELEREDLPHRETSLIWQAARAGATITVHVAVGTDTVHAVPGADGAAIGQATWLDFRRLAAVVARLDGGVYLNVGSAVVLPEVFLKAVAVARNLGHPVEGLTTANLDMIQHYRPLKNVLERPAQRGIALTGHHELLLPLLRVEALRRLAAAGGPR
ncbi:MAG: hypothetical protein AB7N76_35200 [Planctomycetota bacterium]